MHQQIFLVPHIGSPQIMPTSVVMLLRRNKLDVPSPSVQSLVPTAAYAPFNVEHHDNS
jgi:hypothetical protein